MSEISNKNMHLNNMSSYAHFSQVTHHNKHKYPLFNHAKGFTYKLEAGDILYIPKGWWHWVHSYDRCISINYWCQNGNNLNPKIYNGLTKRWPAYTKWTDDYLISIIDSKLPYIMMWTSGPNGAIIEKTTMENFRNTYSKGDKFAYIITLENYFDGKSVGIVELLANDFFFPPELLQDFSPQHLKANFWMNYGNIDTGLHYDDHDGYLCLVSGTKHVTLYAPDQTPYLYPYSVTELEQSPLNVRYNCYKAIGLIPFRSDMNIFTSSDILLQTLHNSPKVKKFTYSLQRRFGPGRIVYSIKFSDNKIHWEYYFYGLNIYPTSFPSIQDDEGYQRIDTLYKKNCNEDFSIEKVLEYLKETFFTNDNYDVSLLKRNRLAIYSIDIDEDILQSGETDHINLYYIECKKLRLPISYKEITYRNMDNYKTKGYVIYTSYENLISHYSIYMSMLNLQELSFDIVNIELSKYKCHETMIAHKGNEIGLYYFGLSGETFLKFLNEYKYPSQFINWYTDNWESLCHLPIEIGIHYVLRNNILIPQRSAIYGIF